ncbi:MAG TPA: hypothetical protein H9900_00145 [Candidatus Monoglobus merdigallinarum]|uniref:Uncharacterized protein n=1 Tax=Candidatus Monoglobus merdigallinarum TaxID=2838698 RepID=A0A9D1TKT9_9FIRM|nr:hypothetical protein [Candidatus Monoglobus merdigallinarum]
MKNRFLKVLISAAAILAVIGGTIVLAEPGDTDDPVVTKSYIVDVVVPQLKAYVEQKMSGGSSDSYSEKFAVVDVSAGQTVIFDEGAEFVLRKGSGTVIGTDKGGIADTTVGYDLANGSEVPANHMLIVPVNDGRGFTASNDVIVMIKGGYSFR